MPKTYKIKSIKKKPTKTYKIKLVKKSKAEPYKRIRNRERYA